jgi:hypothetical protein
VNETSIVGGCDGIGKSDDDVCAEYLTVTIDSGEEEEGLVMQPEASRGEGEGARENERTTGIVAMATIEGREDDVAGPNDGLARWRVDKSEEPEARTQNICIYIYKYKYPGICYKNI